MNAVIGALAAVVGALISAYVLRTTGRETVAVANRAAAASEASVSVAREAVEAATQSAEAAQRTSMAAEQSAVSNQMSATSAALKSATDLALMAENDAAARVGVAQLRVLAKSQMLTDDGRDLVIATLEAVMEPALVIIRGKDSRRASPEMSAREPQGSHDPGAVESPAGEL